MKRFKNGNWNVSNDEMLDMAVALYAAKKKYKELGLFAFAKMCERFIDEIENIHDQSGSEW